MTPHLVEMIAGIEVCRESCPNGLRGASISVYVLMPILWGFIFASVISKRRALTVVFLALSSFSIMLLLTWFLYLHQHPR